MVPVRSLYRVGFSSLVALFLAVPALATTFGVQEITGLSGTRFRGWGMNNNGDVVGVYKESSYTRGFLYSGGSLQQLQTLQDMGMNYDYEMAINDSGRIVGKMAKVYSDSFYPVVWSSPSNYTFLTVPSATGEAAATCINNSNQIGLRPIVGNYDASIISLGAGSTIVEPTGHNSSKVMGIADSGMFAGQATNSTTWLTRGMVGQVDASGALVSLSTFDAFSATESSWASAVNSAGQCVGSGAWGAKDFYNNPYYKAFKRDADGTVHDLGVGTGVRSYATSINEKGYVVGSTMNSNYVHTAVLFSMTGAAPQAIQSMVHGLPSGLTLTEPRVINNNGQILVNALDSGGLYHTLVLTPDPLQKNFTALGDLGAWQAIIMSESAQATVVPDPADASRYVCELITGSPVGISEQVATPANPFALEFDYKAEAAVGTLMASINGTQVGNLDLSGVMAGQWQTANFPVTDSSFWGLLDATVAILYNAPAGSTIYLDNIALTPEPSSVTLLAVGALALLRRKHGRAK